MPGLVISAGSTQVDAEIDQKVDIGLPPEHGRVVDFPGRDMARAPAPLDQSVLRQLCDLLLLPASMLHPQERAFAVDLIHSSLDSAGPDTRREIATRLARAGRVAPSIAARLVRDRDLTVAQPLLRDGVAVADSDLIAIVRAGCPERAYQIAGRARLAAEVAGEIASLAPAIAVYAALRNAGADLTPSVVTAMAARAQADPSLAEPLLHRPEMTAAGALDLFWTVDRRLRVYVLKRFLAESGTVRRILAGEIRTVAGPASSQDGDGDRASAVQGSIMITLECLYRGQVDTAAEDLSHLAGVSPATARRIVRDRGGEALTVAVKAAGATPSTFAAILAAWGDGESAILEPPQAPNELLDLFVRLSRGHAAMAMTYWDWREAACGPYAASMHEPPSCGLPGGP